MWMSLRNPIFKIVIITLIVIFLVSTITIGVMLFYQNGETKKYKEKAEQYLEAEYEKDFVLENHYVGIEKDFMEASSGEEYKETKIFCFLANSIEEEIYSYVTIFLDTQTNEEKIEEVLVEEETEAIASSYLEMKKCHVLRESIIQDLTPYLNEEEDKIYKAKKQTNKLIVEIPEEFIPNYRNDNTYREMFLRRLKDLLKIKQEIEKLEIEVKFDDCKLSYNEEKVWQLTNKNFGTMNFEIVCEYLNLLNVIASTVGVENLKVMKIMILIYISKKKEQMKRKKK